MNNIKKAIFKVLIESSPISYIYSITSGTQACVGGFTDITPITNVSVYSEELRPDWDIGTQIYTDENLTINLGDGFYRSVTAGTVDKFFFQISGGIVTEKILPNTGC